ncbi:MAG: 1-acyl-sn-glycerol-3-phosphate acyltransferase [Candidatus Marinimicrobia bacterium]|nr:1-acyl-sn-glycerol-3-phosphate acyltransferase [Candidatus Neomarinimicrobiota bacterium]
MMDIISIYYWVIGLGYFVPILIIIIVRSFFQSPQKYDPWLRNRITTLFRLINSTPQIEISEELAADKPYIFMANHGSLIDLPLLKAVIPYYYTGIVAQESFKYFLFGQAIRRMGSIAIHRDNIRSSLKSFERATELLRSGIQIVVLPEGSRSLDGKLIPFKKLPFHFAKQSGASIVPVAISGVFEMNNKKSFYLRPGKIIVRFAHTIHAEEIEAMEIKDLMQLTRQRIYENLESFEAGNA